MPCARHHAGDVCGAKIDMVYILLELALLESYRIKYKSYRIVPVNSGAARNMKPQPSGHKMSVVSELGIPVWLHFMVERGLPHHSSWSLYSREELTRSSAIELPGDTSFNRIITVS